MKGRKWYWPQVAFGLICIPIGVLTLSSYFASVPGVLFGIPIIIGGIGSVWLGIWRLRHAHKENS